MSGDTSHDRGSSLQARVHELERQLVGLRRQLEPPVEAPPERPFDVLEVGVDDQRYLVPVSPIREVLPSLWPTRLPDAPAWVRGMFRYGNVLVPLIDLRQRLHDESRDIAMGDVIVLFQLPRWSGLLVTGIHGVFRVEPGDLTPPSPGIPQAPFLVATLCQEGGESAHLLSLERLTRDFLFDDDQ